MQQIVIHRCTVRVVRHGGWSWGARPQELLEALLQALPGLIEAELAELADAAGADRVLTAPVRIVVRVPAGRDAGALARASAAERLDAAAAQRRSAAAAAREQTPTHSDAPPRGAVARPRAATGGARDAAPLVRVATGAEALAALAGGDVARLVAFFSPAALADWVRWTVHAAAVPTAGDSTAAAVRQALAAAVLASSPAGAEPAALAPSAEATAAGESPSQATAPGPPRPEDALERQGAVAPAREAGASPGAVAPEAPARSERVASPVAAMAPSPGSGAVRRGAFDVAALPFIAAGVLARLGYLDAVAAALTAEQLALPAFAQALAAKLLDPPERGWRRSARDDDTLAAVAGLAAPLPGEALLGLAREANAFAAGIDGVVTALLLEDRARDVPVMLLRSARGELAAVDPTGLFVIACGPAALDAVAAAGAPVRAAAEVRAELAGVRSSALRAADEERGTEILAALDARPAVPRAPDATLERSLTLAAALALGTIAWRLWPEEDPDPLLTLQRFGDLEGSASVDRERIVVRLPLGRRRRDLEAGGFLGTVRLPWLGERRLELTDG